MSDAHQAAVDSGNNIFPDRITWTVHTAEWLREQKEKLPVDPLQPVHMLAHEFGGRDSAIRCAMVGLCSLPGDWHYHGEAVVLDGYGASHYVWANGKWVLVK